MMTIKQRALSLVAALSLVLFGASSSNAVPDVAQIVNRANQAAYYAGADGRAKVSMTIADASGRTQQRRFSILRRNTGASGQQKYLVVFERPAELRKTVFLVHKNPSSDDFRWLFMPALDLVKRIGAGDKRTSFVGSHFLYEDVSGRNPDEDHHSLVGTTGQSFVIRGVPKDPSGVDFHHYVAHIDQATYLPRKIEYFDAKERSQRSIEAKAMQVIGGHPTVTKIEVVDNVRGGKTTITFADVEYDIGVPDDVFTERSLRSPPTAWLSGRR